MPGGRSAIGPTRIAAQTDAFGQPHEQPGERVERDERVDQIIPEVARFVRAREKGERRDDDDDYGEVEPCPPGSQRYEEQSRDEFDRSEAERIRIEPRPPQRKRMQERSGEGGEPGQRQTVT